jgi:hypothetical protein
MENGKEEKEKRIVLITQRTKHYVLDPNNIISPFMLPDPPAPAFQQVV